MAREYGPWLSRGHCHRSHILPVTLHYEHSRQSYQNIIIQVRRSKMYSPKIDEDYIPFLYRKAKSQQIPMTRLVNKIIEEYLMQNRLVTILEEDKTTHNNLMSASL
jgi:hypothetical protein